MWTHHPLASVVVRSERNLGCRWTLVPVVRRGSGDGRCAYGSCLMQSAGLGEGHGGRGVSVSPGGFVLEGWDVADLAVEATHPHIVPRFGSSRRSPGRVARGWPGGAGRGACVAVRRRTPRQRSCRGSDASDWLLAHPGQLNSTLPQLGRMWSGNLDFLSETTTVASAQVFVNPGTSIQQVGAIGGRTPNTKS